MAGVPNDRHDPNAGENSGVLAMRRRNVWEAADSGILLWRENFSRIVFFFALPVAITAALLLLIPSEFRWVSWLALWWLKPLFDRLCLHVVSVRFFERRTGFRNIVRGLARNFFPCLAGDLLWRRFSPFRCSTMPLRLMERLKRRQYLQRNRALVPGGLNFSALLSCIGPLLEAILLGGEAVFALVLGTIIFPDIRIIDKLDTPVVFLILYILYCVNYILVESLYVCMGFGIYINSRVTTEGWDIELLFRKFSGRLAAAAKVLLVTVCLLFSFPLFAADADNGNLNQPEAETEQQEPKVYFPPDFMPPESVPSDSLDNILASPDFGGTEHSWRIQLKKQADVNIQEPLDIPSWMEKLREALAGSLRIVLAVILAASLVFLLLRLYRLRHGRGKTEAAANGDFKSNPLSVRGNPCVFFEKAELLYRQGQIRDAWAACLGGVLNALNLYLDIVFPPDVTEYGCLKLLESRCGSGGAFSGQLAAGFSALIRNWVLLEYGAKVPAPESFENALGFGRSIVNSSDRQEPHVAQ